MWFSYDDYLNYVAPTLRRLLPYPTKDPFAYLSDDEKHYPCQIIFSNPPVESPESYPKELNPPPPTTSLESVTFKILKRQVSQFMQSDNPHSFHARFYHPGEIPSSTSSIFHPHEDEDVDMSLPWRVPFGG